MDKVYKLEQGLRYSGAYTRTEISECFSDQDGYDLYSDDNLSGNIVTYESFVSAVSGYDVNGLLSVYRISGNVSGSVSWNVGTPINHAMIKTAYLSGGSIVPFYMPIFSFKVTTGRWWYCGLYVSQYTSSTDSFTTRFGTWFCSGPDANTALTVVPSSATWHNGTSKKDFCVGIGYIRSPYFAVALPEGTTPNPPYDEICLVVIPATRDGGTTQPGSYLTTTWSSASNGNVSFSSLRNCLSLPRCYFLYEDLPLPVDPGPETGPTSGGGGYGNGSFSGASDSIALPGNPGMGVTSAGFIRVYNIGVGGLSSLGFELFPPLAYTAPSSLSPTADTATAIVEGFNAIVTFLANIPSFFDQIMANTLINYVIDCHVIPVSPGAGSSEAIHVGPKTLSTTADRIYTDYVDVSCGSINVAEFYDNFADMLSTAKLYLPFVGFVPVRPEWFQGNTLAVDYKFNVIDGSFSCYVRSGGKYVNNNSGLTIVGQYAGTACMHIPITGVSYASMVSGLVGAGSGMVAGAGSGNIAAAATSAIEAATARGDMASSNAYSSSAAFLGCRVPFLMIERPVSSYSANYAHEYGFPANVYAKLGDVPGFVRMEAVHVDGIAGATEAEKAEIKRLLAQGVIV